MIDEPPIDFQPIHSNDNKINNFTNQLNNRKQSAIAFLWCALDWNRQLGLWAMLRAPIDANS